MSCADGRSADNTYGVAVAYLSAPRNEYALVSVFEQGAILKYYNSSAFAEVASIPLFDAAIVSSAARQPVELQLLAKLGENRLLVLGTFATHARAGLLLAIRQTSSAPFTASPVAASGATECISPFGTFALATSVSPFADYAIFTSYNNLELEAHYLDLTNLSAPASRLTDGLGSGILWDPDDRLDDLDLPVVHQGGKKYCLLASNASSVVAASPRFVFCFQETQLLGTFALDVVHGFPNKLDYAAGSVSVASSARDILYFVCSGGGGFGICSYRPSSSKIENGPTLSA